MQGKSLYTILLSIIAVLSLALAVLIVILLTINPGSAEKPSGVDERIIPIEEQVEFKLYGSDDSKEAVFNIKSTEKHPNSFIMASVSIFYDAGNKSSLLEERKALVENTYLSELKQATIEYFRSKTYEELQAEEGMKKAREELKDIYNKIVGNGTDKKIIVKVIFDRWIIQ